MQNAEKYLKGLEHIMTVIQDLSLARSLEEVMSITKHASRELTGADGATFVLREGDRCFYADEEAIGPLWKGQRFPMSACISGAAMMDKKSILIKDIYSDNRIPHDAYRPTFVKSLLMVPVRVKDPIGAIGNYWSVSREPSAEDVRLLESLADAAAMAIANVQLISDLENSVKKRDQFLSLASHELRTPLSAVKMQLQMTERQLRKKDGFDTIRSSGLEISISQTDRLISLVEQLLDVSHIQLKRMNIALSEFDLTEFTKSVLEGMSHKLRAAGNTLSFSLEEGIIGKWDPTKLEQILVHLLENTARHAAGSKVEVFLRRTDDGRVLLMVKDQGPGISQEVQKKLFLGIERGDTSINLGGLGMGLFISRGIAEAHHGNLKLESEPGKGCVVSITLPNELGQTDQRRPASLDLDH